MERHPTIPEAINAFLRQHAPSDFCDDCIGRSLGHANRQPMVAAALATTSEFSRGLGTCSNCGRLKQVTRAHRV
jgi:hypothetical protein